MKKAKALLSKAKEFEEQAKKIELEYHQKVGKLVVTMYEKNELKDEHLKNKIAKILGDDVEDSAQNLSKSDGV